MKIAADFTMQDQSSLPYAWMMEGSSPDALRAMLAAGDTIEDFVRNYVKVIIENWYEEHRASAATIYKVWRAGWEFSQIVSYVKDTLVEEQV